MKFGQIVSVVIPNYNHSQYLRDRINSIIDQTYENIEVIILDDASTDSSVDIIKDYENHPKLSKIILNKNNSGSVFKQWNSGISLAKGELIWVAESDDVSDITFLEKLVPAFDNLSIMLAFSASYIINNKGDILFDTFFNNCFFSENGFLNSSGIYKGIEVFENVSCSKNFIINASGAVFRKSAWEKIGGLSYNHKIISDWIFWTKLVQLGDLYYTKEILNYHRRHSTNTSSSTVILKEENIKQLKENYIYIDKYNLKEDMFWSGAFDHIFKFDVGKVEYYNFSFVNIKNYLSIDFFKALFYFILLSPQAVRVNLSIFKRKYFSVKR